MSARRKKLPPVADLLSLMEHAVPASPAPVVTSITIEVAVEPVAPSPDPEPEIASESVTQAAVPEFHWSKVDVAAPPKPGAIVRVDGGEWMVWRDIYLIRERREAVTTKKVLSIPRDYALLVPYPDAGALAPMQTIALDRLEVRGQEVQADGSGGVGGAAQEVAHADGPVGEKRGGQEGKPRNPRARAAAQKQGAH